MVILTSRLAGNNLKAFKKAVKLELLSKDWTYEDLSKKTGYTVRTIYNNMSRKFMTKFVASAIAEALGIDISEFEKGEE